MRSFKLSFILLVLLLLFQNCSEVQFGKTAEKSSPSSVLPELTSESGNGGVYEGKIIVLHHYIDDFTCENRKQPESILIRDSDNKWRIIKNKPDKCAYVNGETVEGVVYNAALKQATFENRTYIVPTPYYVDASEDPNLPDINPEDGVCENINYKCSLRASVQQAGAISSSGSTIIHIPPARYRLTSRLGLDLKGPSNSITLLGADPSTTILDGQGATDILVAMGDIRTARVENLGFENGTQNVTFGGSVFSSLWLNGKIEFVNCRFENNQSGAPIYIGNGADADLAVRQSKFINNQDGAISAWTSRSLTVRDSLFVGNKNLAVIEIMTALGGRNVVIESSTFSENDISLSCMSCQQATLSNVTFYKNRRGLHIYGHPSLPSEININNSTIYENGSENLFLLLNNMANVNLNNTILAANLATGKNCVITLTDSGGSQAPLLDEAVVTTNNLITDTSCGFAGTGNLITADPKLSEIGNYGGITPTLVPLPGSLAIDGGDNRTCLTTDQRALPRPVDQLGTGPRCDIGAAEVQ